MRKAENSGREQLPRFGRRPPGVAGAGRKHDSLYVGAIAAAISLSFFRAFYAQGMILLYGDAVAHIHLARRVFDSVTPGILRLGTVWLPLPHLLMIPFLVSDWMWRTGVGGSIVSMIAYAAGTLGIFRLARGRASRAAAWLAAATYALNPNLLYLQATAMTEAIYLALFIWAVAFLDEAVRLREPDEIPRAAHSLERAAMMIAAAMLTRYDGWWLAGWVLAAPFVGAIFLLVARREPARDLLSGIQYRPLRRAARNTVLLLVAVPVLWLAYNHREYGNPLEFATGPYSARAIEQRAATAFPPAHPGQHNLRVAALYFQKVVKLNLGEGRWELPLLALATAGFVLSVVVARRFAVWWLLWLPAPFYILSIAYGSVPVFLPVWWPFSYYNVRYGLELLPAVAVFVAVAVELAGRVGGPAQRAIILTVVALTIAGSYLSLWRSTPICLREAIANSRARVGFERALAESLRRLPPTARILMYGGSHPGALQMAGIPGRRVVDETNHPQWEQALHDPLTHVQYLVAMDDDPVAQAASRHPHDLVPLAIVQSSGQPRTTIYKTQPLPAAGRPR